MIAVGVGLSAAPNDVPSALWAQWRGPERDGVSPGKTWPATLDGLTQTWRVPLGKGYPGPVVAADRVFVVESAADEAAVVKALDRATGKVLWEKRWASGADVPFFAAANGDWVRSTPAYDGKTLFLGDMRETVVALDGATGEEKWRLEAPQRFKAAVPDFGFASSPLVDGDHLYVQAANSLLKLDKNTGAVLWRALASDAGMTESGAFSSPVIATLAGRRQLVVLTRTRLVGVDLGKGDELWSRDVPHFRGMHILTPVVVGDTVFTSPYRQGSYLFAVKKDGERFVVEPRWENKASGYMSTPVVADGHLYFHLGNERLDCLDLQTGESRWRSEPLGKYHSLVRRGEKILALADGGTLHLIKADPRAFTLLASKQVATQPTWGHLAVAGDEVFIRELEAVSAWRWGGG